MESPERFFSEHARFPRYTSDFSVHFRVEGESGAWREARAREISLKGTRISIPRTGQTGDAQPVAILPSPGIGAGSVLMLQLVVPSNSKGDVSLLLNGRVATLLATGGEFEASIVFEEVNEEERYLLVDLIAALLFDGKAHSASVRPRSEAIALQE